MNSSLKLTTALIAGLFLMVPQYPTAATQNDFVQPNCIVTIPSRWGEFKSASAAGLVFEDSAGTLRVVGNTPCQISGTANAPIVALEVRRK